MAQTKKRRKRKHRGTPAGTVEARGRTGRAPVKKDAKAISRERRAERMAKPPSWRSSLNRSVIAAIVFAVAVVVFFSRPVAEAALLGVTMVALYWPMTYFLDSYLYRRRQRQLAAADGGRQRSRKD